MLNSGKKFRVLRDKKNNILTLVLSEKKNSERNKIPNPPPPPLQVKWSVLYHTLLFWGEEYLLCYCT